MVKKILELSLEFEELVQNFSQQSELKLSVDNILKGRKILNLECLVMQNWIFDCERVSSLDRLIFSSVYFEVAINHKIYFIGFAYDNNK